MTNSNKPFIQYTNLFENKSLAFQMQMTCFWNWLKKQKDVPREYKYIAEFEKQKEKAILKEVVCLDGRFFAKFQAKKGRKVYQYNLFESPFFMHFKVVNQEAGKWIND